MKRWSWILLLLLAACGKPPIPAAPLPRTVLAHTVGTGSATGFAYGMADYSGEVRARHEISLAFRVGGKLLTRGVDVGDRVSPGQELARLDASDLALSSAGAEANLAAATADRDFAQAEARRYRDLRAQQFVSAALLDAKEATLKAAEERYRALTAQAGLARNQRGYTDLRCDISGVVIAVQAEAGQVLTAGQPVLQVAGLGEKEVLIAVPENQVAELNPGKTSERPSDVVVTLWAAPNKRYRGRVREVSPQADPVTRTYAARVSILNADADVRLGQTARVLVAHAGTGSFALIPLGSVFQQGTQPAVWLIASDSRVHLRPVEVAAWREDGVTLRGGLTTGERIVAAGAYKLTEGEKVRVAAP